MEEAATAVCIACDNQAMGECPECESWFCDAHYVAHVFSGDDNE